MVEYTKKEISSLKANPWNPNEMGEKTQAFLVREIKRMGFLQPILINKDGMIIDGEHRWRAAKDAGLKEIPVVQIDVDDNQARILTMNMNQIKGDNNPVKVAELIKELQTDFDDTTITNYLNFTKNEIESYNLILSLPEVNDADLIPKTETSKEVICPSCKFKFTINKS